MNDEALELDRRSRALKLTPAEKLRQACEMMELSIATMRKNLKRRNPVASEPEIEALLMRWMLRQP